MIEQRSEEWFRQRVGRITGSNVGAALGMNPWKSEDDLIREMVRAYHGAPSEFQGNAATAYGQFHEAGAQAEYEMEVGDKVQECGFFVHPEHDWLGASPDGLILGGLGVLEIKCPYALRDKKQPQFKTAKEQPHYYAQMQIEMECTGAGFCNFYQWSPASTKREVVFRDDEWIAKHLPTLRAVHERYLSELDNPEHLKPRRRNVATKEAAHLLSEYDELSEAIELAQQRKKAVLDRLTDLAHGEDAEIFGRKLTKVERKGSVAYSKVIKDHLPDVDLEPYRGKPSESWRLT